MTTHEQNLRTDARVTTDDAYGGSDGFEETGDFRGSDIFGGSDAVGSDAVSVDHDGEDLLLSPEDRLRFGQHWTDIQSRFVDDPGDAVASADDLVAEVMDCIGDRLAERRSVLGQGLAGEGEAETEDLRLATQRYRAFFHRLLST